MASLEIVNIKKRYGDVEVLKGIDIVVEAGEFLVLVGPSGCGKSTLLSSRGSTPCPRRHRDRRKRVNDLRATRHCHGVPVLRAVSNMSECCTPSAWKCARSGRARAPCRTSQTLQIDHLLQRRPAQLSGGQRQRVAMGRALVRKPRIFLFDEPLSNLDAQLRVDMRTEIKKLHQRLGATIVYVTHDQIEAMTLATRIAVMRNGELQQLGTPAEIYSRPSNTFVAGFMGSPRMNLLPGLLRSEGGNSWLEIAAEGSPVARLPVGPLPEAVRGYVAREIIAGLRPEAITDNPNANGATRPVVEARVEVTEPTGPDTLAVLELGGLEVTARLRPDTKLSFRRPGRFAVDLCRWSGSTRVPARESVNGLRRGGHRLRSRGRLHRTDPGRHRRAHPHPGARRAPAARSTELGRGSSVRQSSVSHARHLARRRRACIPPWAVLLRRRPHQVLWRCHVPLPGAGLRGRGARRRCIARLADPLCRPGAVLRSGRALVRRARARRR